MPKDAKVLKEYDDKEVQTAKEEDEDDENDDAKSTGSRASRGSRRSYASAFDSDSEEEEEQPVKKSARSPSKASASSKADCGKCATLRAAVEKGYIRPLAKMASTSKKLQEEGWPKHYDYQHFAQDIVTEFTKEGFPWGQATTLKTLLSSSEEVAAITSGVEGMTFK